MKRRHMILAAGVLLAAGLALFGDKTPDSGVADAVARPRASAPAAPLRASQPAPAKPAAVPIARLVSRADLIGAESGADALFASKNWTPAPKPVAVQAQVAPPPPMAPPLPFSYLGKSLGDGQWEVYLARGERTFIVRVGVVIDGTYRVDAITPPMLSITYLPLNQVQQLNIGVLD